MSSLRIPTPLRSYTNGISEIQVEGDTVGQAMKDLIRQHPALEAHLFNDQGELRPFVNLYMGEENVNALQGMETPLMDGQRLMIIPSIAGGA